MSQKNIKNEVVKMSLLKLFFIDKIEKIEDLERKFIEISKYHLKSDKLRKEEIPDKEKTLELLI
jgi:hypothetical protein